MTSETGTVVHVDARTPSLSIRMDDDNEIRRLEGPEIGAHRLAHGYAVTVHRSQGSPSSGPTPWRTAAGVSWP
ncbi:MAG: hypothetical protein M3326_15530 [Actinomycetota bacterium]|nr:hypothetical protein [Actinomycetota bacterium]